MHLNVASFHQMVIVENAKDARRTDCGMRISDCGFEESAEAFSFSIRNPKSAFRNRYGARPSRFQR